MNIKFGFFRIYCLFLLSIVILGCDRNIPQVAHQTLYVKFVNKAGENLVEKNNIVIDSAKYSVVHHFLKENEYHLSLNVDGVAFAPDLPLDYGVQNWSLGFIEFGCAANNRNLKNKRNSYTYEYSFVCPKLFGSDKPQKLTVVWGTRKKTIYNLVKEIRFNGELIEHSDERNIKAIIMLEQ